MKFRDFKEEAAGVGIVTKQNATKVKQNICLRPFCFL